MDREVGARLLGEPLDRAFEASVVTELLGRQRGIWKAASSGGENDGLQGLGGLDLRDADLVLLDDPLSAVDPEVRYNLLYGFIKSI